MSRGAESGCKGRKRTNTGTSKSAKRRRNRKKKRHGETHQEDEGEGRRNMKMQTKRLARKVGNGRVKGPRKKKKKARTDEPTDEVEAGKDEVQTEKPRSRRNRSSKSILQYESTASFPKAATMASIHSTSPSAIFA